MNKFYVKYLFIIPSSSIKYNCYRWKPVDLLLAAPGVCQMLSWWRHINKCIAIEYLSITCRGGFIQRLQCMPLKVIDISNEVLHSYTTESCLLIHFHYCFYVTSQIQFPVKIMPRLFIACLNTAALIKQTEVLSNTQGKIWW